MAEPVYPLASNTISPTRIVGRNRLGMPIEETVCTFPRHALVVDADGNITDAPLGNGCTTNHSPEAQRYEMLLRKDLILAGALFVEECPYTTEYRWLVGDDYNGGRLVALPPGETGCSGKKRPADHPPGAPFFGCSHMEPIIKERRAACRKRNELLEQQAAQMTPAQARKLLAQMGNAIEQATAIAESEPDEE